MQSCTFILKSITMAQGRGKSYDQRGAYNYNFGAGTRVSPNADNNEGLPNVGLTCFLNSVIQLLYSAENFRKAVNKAIRGHAFIKALAKIFKDIQDKESNKTKEQDLKTFIDYLKQIDTDYHLHTCQDALEFLLLIINQINQHSANLVNKFELQYQTTCKCLTSTSIFKEFYLTSKDLTCTHCRKTIQTKIIAPSEYLICLCSREASIDQRKYYNQRTLIYNQCAAILYEGNGKFGHYIARRLVDGQFKLFDDNSIISQRQWGRPLILLYQKIDKMEQNSERNPSKIPSSGERNNERLTNYTDAKRQEEKNKNLSSPTIEKTVSSKNIREGGEVDPNKNNSVKFERQKNQNVKSHSQNQKKKIQQNRAKQQYSFEQIYQEGQQEEIPSNKQKDKNQTKPKEKLNDKQREKLHSIQKQQSPSKRRQIKLEIQLLNNRTTLITAQDDANIGKLKQFIIDNYSKQLDPRNMVLSIKAQILQDDKRIRDYISSTEYSIKIKLQKKSITNSPTITANLSQLQTYIRCCKYIMTSEYFRWLIKYLISKGQFVIKCQQCKIAQLQWDSYKEFFKLNSQEIAAFQIPRKKHWEKFNMKCCPTCKKAQARILQTSDRVVCRKCKSLFCFNCLDLWFSNTNKCSNKLCKNNKIQTTKPNYSYTNQSYTGNQVSAGKTYKVENYQPAGRR